jgi:crotonobetainyl-CoA:carnitine CoA-transferase CaiB-like acyl-CoA transferase
MTALRGIRVLDLSRVLAGPSCGQLLADLGAEVIKVEDRAGDENRRWAPVVDGRGANFFSVNRGKRGMTLNLKSAKGQEILEGLVRRADVLLENFPPPTAERLGLSHARLIALNPRLIHVSITGYCGGGPL